MYSTDFKSKKPKPEHLNGFKLKNYSVSKQLFEFYYLVDLVSGVVNY